MPGRCLPSSSLSAIALKIRGFCLTGYEEAAGRAKPWLPSTAPGVPAAAAFRSVPFLLCVGVVMLCKGRPV